MMSDAAAASEAAPQFARRGSATGMLANRLGSYAWESYEHPANIPLHPPAQPAAAARHEQQRLIEQQQQAQHSPAAMMLAECKQ